MIFDENNIGNENLIFRSNHNFYIHFDENDITNSDTSGYKEYSDDEIKLLFAIDPYGVCDYVNRFADTKETLEKRVEYKDYIFRLLFNREPQYFIHDTDGKWYPASKDNELNDIMSESETYFGGHRIWDKYAWINLREDIVTIACMVAPFLPKFAVALKLVSNTKALEDLIKVASFIASGVTSGFVSSGMDNFVVDRFEGTPLYWAYNFVAMYADIIELLSDVNSIPNYYSQIFDYCIDESNYQVNIELSDGEIYNLKIIRDALEVD